MHRIPFLLIILLLWLGTSVRPSDAQFRKRDTLVLAPVDSVIRVDPTKHYHLGGPASLNRESIFGGTLGSPGGLNFVAGGYYDGFGIMIEGGGAPLLFSTIDGYEAELNYVVAGAKSALLQIALSYSFTEILDIYMGTQETSRKLCVAYGANVGGFFVEMGIGHLLGTSRVFNCSTFQIGYVH